MSKISEITRASNVASTDLILITGNVGSEETSYAVPWKNCNDYYKNHITVAKDGGDYSTIQSAINSITNATSNNVYVISIYPGTYSENITMKAYVSLQGITASRGQIKITASSGNVITLPTDGNCAFKNIGIFATGTAKAVYVTTGSTSEYEFSYCGLRYIQSGGYTNLIHLESGTSSFIHCTMNYTSTGVTSGINYHRALHIDGTSTYHLHGCHVTASIDDTDDILDMVEEDSSEYALVVDSEFDAYGTANVRCFDVESAGVRRDYQSNHIHLHGNSAGTGIIYKMNNVASEIHSTGNRLICEDFNDNFYANVSSLATLVSHFDDIVAEDSSEGSGSIVLASSTFDGHVSQTNSAIQVYDATGGVDCNTAAGLAILFDT